MARLPEPGKDSGDWGKILNEFLLVSHTADGYLRLPTWKTEADRIANPAEGQVGINLGSGCAEIFKEGRWVSIEDSVEVVLGISRSLRTRASERLSILDFGVTPNANEDCAPQIARAIEYCRTTKRGELFFPSGSYQLKSPLLIGSLNASAELLDYGGLTLRGEGSASALQLEEGIRIAGCQRISLAHLGLFLAASGKTSVELRPGIREIVLADIAFSGQRNQRVQGASVRIVGESLAVGEIRDVRIDTCSIRQAALAIRCELARGVSVQGLEFNQCLIEDCESGFEFHGESTSSELLGIRLRNSSVRTARTAVRIDGLAGIILEGCDMQVTRANEVVHVRGASAGMLRGNRISGHLLSHFVSFESAAPLAAVPRWLVAENLFQGSASDAAVGGGEGVLAAVTLGHNLQIEPV